MSQKAAFYYDWAEPLEEMTITPKVVGDRWRCGNCGQEGIMTREARGFGDWHGPGSALCSIRLLDNDVWECKNCGQKGTMAEWHRFCEKR